LPKCPWNDLMSLVEVMSVADDEIALTGCVACPRNLAGMPIGRLDLKVLDAFVVADHAGRKRPETIVLLVRLAHRGGLYG